VSVYLHHGAWWLDYHDSGQQVRRKIADTRNEAEQVAAQATAQLTSGAPTLLAFNPTCSLPFSVPLCRSHPTATARIGRPD
jgi:hypothetical protein